MTLIVFTDLDGSLLDHESYSTAPAKAALGELAARKIPLILNSSKTADEIIAIKRTHGIEAPFVCENGAALHLSPESVIPFGPLREQWLHRVHELRDQRGFVFEGFDDWSSTSISKRTGRTEQEALLAKRRVYSEPILWRDSQEALRRFQDDLSNMGLRLLQGGRFQSIQGHFDKRNAMDWLAARAEKQEVAPVVVALGDSPNDAAMLNAADVAVIIKSANSSLIHCPDAKLLIHTTLKGPAGWSEAILQILALHDSKQLQFE